MDIHPHQPCDAGAEGGQGADAAAAGIEDDGTGRRQGVVDEVVQDLCGGRAQAQARQDGEPTRGTSDVRGAPPARQAADGAGTDAVGAAGVMGSTVSSQRSASMAAWQPSPAAVTACR